MAKGKGKTHPDIIRARLRENEAIKLRMAGVEYGQIADKIETSVSGAYDCVRRVLDRVTAETNETGTACKTLDLLRIDTMLMAVWPRVLKGDLQAIATALRLLERRAKMIGYDAPTRLAPTSPDGESSWTLEGMTVDQIAEVRAEVEKMLRAAA